MNKRTLTMKDIEEIIQSIPGEDKVLYDRTKIERLYVQFQNRKIDDAKAVEEIRNRIGGRKILLLAPGQSLQEEYEKIMEFIRREHPYVISVNFVDTAYRMDACFVSNHKRMDIIEREIRSMKDVLVILTSNIPAKIENSLRVDYKRYTNGDELILDNAGLMLLKLLKECKVNEAALAGFDGFGHRRGRHYYSPELNLQTDAKTAALRQERIRKQIKELQMELHFLTRSAYEEKDHV